MKLFDINLKRVIALRAGHNRGKTETLCMLIDNLMACSNDFEQLETELIPRKKDRFVVFKHLESGGLIGVTTGADNEKAVTINIHFIQNHFEKYAPSPYGIWVTATRTRASTVKKIEEFADAYKADLVVIRKLRKRKWENSDEAANKRYCELLYKNLLLCIDELKPVNKTV